MQTELEEIVAEIRLSARMAELLHGEYKYQGWIAMWREWADRIEEAINANRS